MEIFIAYEYGVEDIIDGDVIQYGIEHSAAQIRHVNNIIKTGIYTDGEISNADLRDAIEHDLNVLTEGDDIRDLFDIGSYLCHVPDFYNICKLRAWDGGLYVKVSLRE